jgi:hypothetical protein
MSKGIGCLLVALALAVATGSARASNIENAAVLEIAIIRSYGNYVFIHLDATPQSQPGCHSNSHWQYTLSLDGASGKELYAMLLSARLSGKRVNIVGAALCTEFGQIESLNGLYIVE